MNRKDYKFVGDTVGSFEDRVEGLVVGGKYEAVVRNQGVGACL